MTLTTLLWILLLQFLFGLNYIVSKSLVTFYSPELWAAMRALFTGVVLLFYLLIKRKLDFNGVMTHRKGLVFLAATGVFINQSCFLLGLKSTTSYNSALINTLIPLVTMGLAAFKKTETLTKKQIFAFFVALMGVWMLTPIHQFTLSNTTLRGDLLTLMNVIAYSSYLVLSREFLKHRSHLWVTTWVFLLGSVPLTIFALPLMKISPTVMPPKNILLSLVYGLVGGTLAPYLILSFILKNTKSSTVALFVYLQPAIVGFFSFVLFGYRPSHEAILATALIFLGVFLATSPRVSFLTGD